MKKNFIICLALLSSTYAFSQKNLWKEMNAKGAANLDLVDRSSTPTEYKIFNLDQVQAKPFLASLRTTETIVTFPNEDGTFTNYKVKDASIMHPDLQAKYANIRSFVGESLDKTQKIRFSFSPQQGLHAIIFKTDGGVSYIDSYSKDLNNYIVYNRKHIENTLTTVCHTEDAVQNGLIDELESQIKNNKPVNDGLMRKYRLALATTIEYSKYHVNRANGLTLTEDEQKAIVMEAINVAMTRVNGVYEKELSVTMELIPNNDKIIFITTDEYTNDDGRSMLGENQRVVDAAIGKDNYDVGHVFSTGGGGVAYLRSPCGVSKAGGVTGLGAPINDAFYIDFVAHEMGHQFGAPHTFNNSCGNNISTSTSVEPGSGSTIMAYAGICPPNVSRNSDPYFANISIENIESFITSTSGSCSINKAITNTAPVVTVEKGLYLIPHSTAFVLDAKAVDAESDQLSYVWEQADPTRGELMPPVSGNKKGPMFRSWLPVKESYRYFPKLSKIVNNQIVFETNPYLAPASQLPNNNWEVVPNNARKLNFTVLVRDNNVLGGQTGQGKVRVELVEAGPFVVTSQTENTIWRKNETQTITWDVASTNIEPINTSHVTILLSLDGGVTFDYVLAENVNNSGTYTFNVPAGLETEKARLMIKAVGNVFLAVNKVDFNITEKLGMQEMNAEDAFTLSPNPSNGQITLTANKVYSSLRVSVMDFTGKKVFERNLTAKAGNQHQIQLNQLPNGVYLVNIQADNYQFTKKLIIKK